jgi:hypothetical protein
MVISPIQTSFAGGELSPRLRGRFDTDIYAKALALARNWEPTPQGSIRTRPGTRHLSPIATAIGARLVPFKVAGGQDYILELGNQTLRIYDSTGRVQADGASLLLNGTFLSNLASWTVVNVTWSSLYGGSALISNGSGNRLHQDVNTGAAANFRVRVTRHNPGPAGTWRVTSLDEATVYGSGSIALGSNTGVVAVPNGPVRIILSQVSGNIWVDDVEFRLTGADVTAATPWTLAQLADVQFVHDTAANKMYFAHPNAAPRELIYVDALTWTFQSLAFTGAPAEWTGTNYPAVIEIWQGRLWLGATPAQRAQVWFSKSGDYYTFMPGSNPGDSSSFKLQTRGTIRWLQGQSQLLVGTDLGEHAATSSTGVVTPTDVQVNAVSAFGSAPLQALHAGDQVFYVSGDRRKLRALRYSLEAGSWDSRDITFVAEHLTAARVKEIHHARDPDGTIVLLLEDGTAACCTYNRLEQVSAWWRFEPASGAAFSAAVSDGPNGSRTWLALSRDDAGYLETLDFHDEEVYSDAAVIVPNRMDAPAFPGNVVPPDVTVGASFALASAAAGWTSYDVGRDIVFNAGGRYRVTAVASSISATVQVIAEVTAGDLEKMRTGSMTWTDFRWAVPIAHLAGEVAIVNDGAYDGLQTIADGRVTLPQRTDVAYTLERASVAAIVGLPYTPTAVTLPLERGNPRGSAQGAKKRFVKVGLVLNDSALPLVNGRRAAPDRTPATPQDQVEPRMTGKAKAAQLGWDDGAQITIEQDLPFRTEVLAIFGVAAVNEV